jgi:hypothetical protein
MDVYRNPKGGEGILQRMRIAVFLALSLGLTGVASSIYGKDGAVDIGIQSTTDVQAEVAPCG